LSGVAARTADAQEGIFFEWKKGTAAWEGSLGTGTAKNLLRTEPQDSRLA